jgi:thioredoxin-related protein
MIKKPMNTKLFISAVMLLIAFTFIINPVVAQEKIEWMTFEEAVEKANKKPKHIFIDVYTDWCGWCKKMDASTFVDPVIVELMNKHFYAVKLDAEQKDTIRFMDTDFVNPNPAGRRSSHQLAAALLKGKMSYPSFVFLNAETEWLTVINGYVKSPELEKVLTYFGKEVYESQTWEDFTADFVGKAKLEEAQ